MRIRDDLRREKMDALDALLHRLTPHEAPDRPVHVYMRDSTGTAQTGWLSMADVQRLDALRRELDV